MLKRKVITVLLSIFMIISTLTFSQTTVKAKVANGWQKNETTWCYYKDGAMQTGWVKDVGIWYYLFNSGSMAVNTTVDGWKLDGGGAGTAIVPVVSGVVTVSSVGAINASSIKVVLSSAPADTSKVTFAVNSGLVPITIVATWNAANTEATLVSSSNLPVGTYSVDVKNNTTDLGTSSITVSEQKIAHINITSTKLGVVTNSDNYKTGYATYKVLDQYGNDITTSSLANSLVFQSSVAGNVSAKNGLIKLTGPSNLDSMTLSSVVITGFDLKTGISTSATLSICMEIK